MKKFTTTASFISSHVKPSGYALDEIIETEGYTAKGDRGAARWKALGTVGTASVNPLTNNSPNLSDASGNEFVLVGEGVIDLNVLGGTTAAYVNIATAAGLTYSQGLTSDASNDIKNIDTVANAIADTSLAVGDAVMIKERANGIFDVISGTGTANTYNIIAHSTLSVSLDLRTGAQPLSLTAFTGLGDGVSDYTGAIRAWATFGESGLAIDGGVYMFNNSTPLSEFPANTTLTIADNSKLLFTDNTTNSIELINKDNITITGGTIEGASGTGTGSDGIVATTCNNLRISKCKVTQFNGIGVALTSCKKSSIKSNELHNNSAYGVQDKSGVNNKILNNLCHSNGRTIAGVNTIGRGIVTWMTTNGDYSHNQCYNNTEYGLRIYSQAGDVVGTDGCSYSDNKCYGNGTAGDIELYVFNESNLVRGNTFANNIVKIDGVVSSIGISVQGDDNTFSNNMIINTNNDQTGSAYQLFNCSNSIISGGIVKGVATVCSFSGSSGFIPDAMTIRNIKSSNVASFIPSITYYGVGAKGHNIYNNEATHGGAGTDNGIVLTSWAEGQFKLSGNRMDGFNKGFTISDVAVDVTDNTAINSTTWGCEVTTSSNSRVEMFGNHWDKAFPASKCNMSQGRTETQGSRVTSSNVSPASDSRLSAWQDGDYCHKTTVSIDGNGRVQAGWICSVSGTPGTWDSVFSSSSTWI